MKRKWKSHSCCQIGGNSTPQLCFHVQTVAPNYPTKAWWERPDPEASLMYSERKSWCTSNLCYQSELLTTESNKGTQLKKILYSVDWDWIIKIKNVMLRCISENTEMSRWTGAVVTLVLANGLCGCVCNSICGRGIQQRLGNGKVI